MRFDRAISMMALALALALAQSACGQKPSEPTPAAGQPSPTVVAAAATPTTAPTRAPASPTAATGPSPADLAAKARTATEFSFDLKITAPGPAGSGKVNVKGTKLREEATISGQSIVMIVDTATKVAYMMQPGQKTAVKADFSQIAAQAPNPSDIVSGLPPNARFVGTESVDGKSASVYEVTAAQTTTRFYLWNDRGLPLRSETTTAQGKVTIDFTNYQFGPQADSLFELPPGTTIVEIPSSIPGAPGSVPTPKP